MEPLRSPTVRDPEVTPAGRSWQRIDLSFLVGKQCPAPEAELRGTPGTDLSSSSLNPLAVPATGWWHLDSPELGVIVRGDGGETPGGSVRSAPSGKGTRASWAHRPLFIAGLSLGWPSRQL